MYTHTVTLAGGGAAATVESQAVPRPGCDVTQKPPRCASIVHSIKLV